MILAVVLTALLLFGWDAGMRYFYPQANKPKPVAAASNAPAPEATASAKPTREGGLTNAADQALEAKDLQTALNPAGRIPIAAPGLSGSLNLTGGVVDDLTLNHHTAAIAKDSGPQRIFSPAGTPAQQYAQFGFLGQGVGAPNAGTVWTAPQGAKLTPQTPVTLTWNNGAGQTYSLTYAIDDAYMITVRQAVANGGAAPVSVKPFALVNRTDKTASLNSWNIHSGPFGAFDGSVDFSIGYNCKGLIFLAKCVSLQEEKLITNVGKTDWVGFTDIYWMSTLIPDAAGATSDFRSLGGNVYRADMVYGDATVAPGSEFVRTTRLFAGAKESNVLDKYEASGIPHFGLAIDWGWFRWFEKPIFWLLKSLFSFAGNFGVAIILLTLIVRGVMFPIAQRQFASMAAMRAIQPKMKALQERYKD
ncbi:MAG: membrane protein insertase YidC, partial [Sphingomonadales bacterium]|nr:membrane protein insertase YidC [Sphingomonadales bacterium]